MVGPKEACGSSPWYNNRAMAMASGCMLSAMRSDLRLGADHQLGLSGLNKKGAEGEGWYSAPI